MIYSLIKTPVGNMLAIADEHQLHALTFHNIAQKKQSLQQGLSAPIQAIQAELGAYFGGTLREFTTPLSLSGTPFQQQVWKMLMQIPYGETWSYAQLAKAIKRPTAFRAVANANGANRFAIIIPCHRVIQSDGGLGGYTGGLQKKVGLLRLEQKSAH